MWARRPAEQQTVQVSTVAAHRTERDTVVQIRQDRQLRLDRENWKMEAMEVMARD
jgi:hypothetical protein